MSDTRRITTIYFFQNGMAAVFDQNGQQMSEYQGTASEAIRKMLLADLSGLRTVEGCAPQEFYTRERASEEERLHRILSNGEATEAARGIGGHAESPATEGEE